MPREERCKQTRLCGAYKISLFLLYLLENKAFKVLYNVKNIFLPKTIFS